LDEFGDFRTARLVQFARKIAIGLGNGIRFTVDSLQGVAPSGLSNRRLRRFFLNFPESRHELEIHEVNLASLHGEFAEVVSTDEILANLTVVAAEV